MLLNGFLPFHTSKFFHPHRFTPPSC